MTYTLANSDEEIDEIHDVFVDDDSYEGAVIRKLTGPESYYKFGRGANALKFKKFESEEGLIVGVIEGKGTNKGLAVFEYVDPRGNTGTVTFGNHDQRKRWFEHPEEVLDLPLEYQFFGLSVYKKARFPTGLRFRDEDVDEKTGKITKIVEGTDYDLGLTHYIVKDEDGFKVDVRSRVPIKKNTLKVGQTIKFKFYGVKDDDSPAFPFLVGLAK